VLSGVFVSSVCQECFQEWGCHCRLISSDAPLRRERAPEEKRGRRWTELGRKIREEGDLIQDSLIIQELAPEGSLQGDLGGDLVTSSRYNALISRVGQNHIYTVYIRYF